MKYHLYQLFALLAIVTLLFSCGKEEPTQPIIVSVTGITLDCSSMTMSIGEEHTLTASLSPDNATNKKVKWSSSNSSVVTVDEGKIKAIDEGEATITATTEDGGKTAICKITVSKPYFSFNTVNDTETNSLSIFALKANLQYSYDGKTWNDCEEDKEMEFGDGKTLMIQGVDNNVGNEPLCRFYFTKETKVECSGNIMYLLDCKHQETVIKRSYCFSGMFYGCKSLTKAPELPATQLAEHCYERMFFGCFSLRDIPELPATQLAEYCYSGMFSGCSSLAKAPALPAVKLAGHCYSEMFSGCFSLENTPLFSEVQLAEYCYSNMFSGCNTLTETSALPTVKLAGHCYEGMFSMCKSLKIAPSLPAIYLVEHCYSRMFSGCSSLTKAPLLPAPQLAEYCYANMFSGCTSMTEPPALTASELAKSCYYYMFSGCDFTTEAPALPATRLADNCYEGMFADCPSLTKAPVLPATKLTYGCYMGMFSGCTSLCTAPELLATHLTDYCYSSMFKNCTSLTFVCALFISYNNLDILNMLDGVNPSGTFFKHRNATWDKPDFIPKNWGMMIDERF